MRELSHEAFSNIIKNRMGKKRLFLHEIEIFDMNLAGWNLSNIDFRYCVFHKIKFDGANMENSSVYNALFDECSLRNTNFRNANLQCAALRHADMEGCIIEGANLYRAILEYAKLEDIVFDKKTKWFRLHCPDKGPFLGYKKCLNNRLVQLLIPSDARRSSATGPTCRCDKAKVLTIKSFDFKEKYTEAWSLADENFVYRVGEWVEVKNFNDKRWMDSTTGIHFWLTREEAKNY